jgi:hypothetical protein
MPRGIGRAFWSTGGVATPLIWTLPWQIHPSKPGNLRPPTGLVAVDLSGVASPSCQKYFTHPDGQIISTSLRILCSSEGRLADRHERWVQDAVDALRAIDECTRSVRRSHVVLTSRRWRQVGDDCFGNRVGDGDNKARSPGRAWNKP